VVTLGDRPYSGTIPAKDLQGTRRFYEDVLGLTVEREYEGGIMFRSGSTVLDLYPTQFAGTAQHTLGGWEVDDLEGTVAALRGRGVQFEEYDMPGLKTENGIATIGDERAAWFKDPEGNILVVFQRL
jgi:catechol 2,3-dioxygenase-like lactoylglutathione lyase family enzyme